MTGTEIGTVVDKLAEKIGVAVDKVQPIAEEALRQYAMRNYIGGIINVILFFIGAWALRFGYKVTLYFSRAVSPLPALLGF